VINGVVNSIVEVDESEGIVTFSEELLFSGRLYNKELQICVHILTVETEGTIQMLLFIETLSLASVTGRLPRLIHNIRWQFISFVRTPHPFHCPPTACKSSESSVHH
jgi:hypothetical protein